MNIHKTLGLLFLLVALACTTQSMADDLPSISIVAKDQAGVVQKIFKPGDMVTIETNTYCPDSSLNKSFKVSATATLRVHGVAVPLNLANALGGKNAFPGSVISPLLDQPVGYGGSTETFRFRVHKKTPDLSKVTVNVVAVINKKTVRSTLVIEVKK